MIDIDDCKESPCNNGGTCLDGVASYTCACPLGFVGLDCERSEFDFVKLLLNRLGEYNTYRKMTISILLTSHSP